MRIATLSTHIRHHVATATGKIGVVLCGWPWQEVCRVGALRRVIMAQHFLLSAAARSLSAAKIMRMSERGVENVFLRLRWPETDGRPVCPHCGCTICYTCPRSAGHSRWRCKACRGDFSVTSGTLFAWHKLPPRTYLLAIAVFCNEVKGKSMLAFARDLDVQYKTAFVLAHKLREAMASSIGLCASAVKDGSPRSTAPGSVAMSGRRTWRPIGSTAGLSRTSRANAGSSW